MHDALIARNNAGILVKLNLPHPNPVAPLVASPLVAIGAPAAERKRPSDRGLSLALAHAWLKRASEAVEDSPLEDSLLNLLSAARSRRGR